jgi:hypothetical protein
MRDLQHIRPVATRIIDGNRQLGGIARRCKKVSVDATLGWPCGHLGTKISRTAMVAESEVVLGGEKVQDGFQDA